MKSMEYSRISGQERNDPSSRHKGGCVFLSSKIHSFSYFDERESTVYPCSCRTVYLLISSHTAGRWLIERSLYQWDPIRNTSFQRHIDESFDQKNRKQVSRSSESFPVDQWLEVHRRADWSRHVAIVTEPTNGRLSKTLLLLVEPSPSLDGQRKEEEIEEERCRSARGECQIDETYPETVRAI